MADTQERPRGARRIAKNGNTYYESQYNGKTYDKEVADQIKVRVRKGDRAKLNEYIDRKRAAEPDNPKYKTLNSMIVTLLREETGLDL